MDKLVSVVIPLYNAEKYIEKTLRSILNQTYSNFEIVIVDDASTDSSIDIVKNICDSRIRLYCNEDNEGIAYTRNRAISLSKGEYIALMDDDDIAPEYRLKDEVDVLNKNPDLDIVAGNTYSIDENDQIIGMFKPVYHNSELLKYDMMFCNQFGNGSALIRKDFIVQNEIEYRDNMYGAEDYRFWTECVSKGANIYTMDKIMLSWRKHNSESVKLKNSIERDLAIWNIRKFLIESYGFKLSFKEYEVLESSLKEDAIIANEQELKELYKIFIKICEQAENLGLNEKILRLCCRKRYGMCVSKAFFLWER